MFKKALCLVLLLLAPLARAADSLPDLPAPADSFDVGILHVEKFGAGPQPIILIPGLACGSWVWADTIQKLAPTHTLYALTLPGFNGRPAAPDEKSLFAAFTRDFWLLLDKQKIDHPILIGHSIGGTLAIALAQDHPERLAAIVAVDGLPIFPAVATATPEQRQNMAKQIAAVYASLTPAAELDAEKNYMTTIGTSKPELVEPTAKLETKSDPKAVAAWLQEDLTTDLRPDLKKITIPFLELVPYDPADASGPFPRTQKQTLAFYKFLLAGAPQLTLTPITPSRHFAMLDQPDAFHKILVDFFASLH